MTTVEDGRETTAAEGTPPPDGATLPPPAGGDGGRRWMVAAGLAAAAAVAALLLYRATAGKPGAPGTPPPLRSVAELNTVAPDLGTVFLYVPGADNAPLAKESAEALAAAEKSLLARGVRAGRFTLPPGSPDHASFAANMALPAIAVLTKGKGAGVVSGAVSEAALMQAWAVSAGEGAPPPSGGAPSGKGP